MFLRRSTVCGGAAAHAGAKEARRFSRPVSRPARTAEKNRSEQSLRESVGPLCPAAKGTDMTTGKRAGKQCAAASSPDPMARHPDAPAWGEITRRGLLGAALGGTTLAAAAVPALARDSRDEVPLDQVTPTFFGPQEWVLLIAIVDVFIPADGDGPGALEAGVPVFIDRQMAGFWGQSEWWYMEGPHHPDADPNFGFQSPLTLAEIIRGGLSHFDEWCRDQHGAAFAELNAEDRNRAVGALMDEKTGLPPELRDFPDFLLTSTKQGYFSDPRHGGNRGMIAWSYIGYPGARANFLSWTNPARDAEPYPLGPVSINGDRA